MADTTEIISTIAAAGSCVAAIGAWCTARGAEETAKSAVEVARSTDGHIGELATVTRRSSAPQIAIVPLSVKMLHVVGLANHPNVAAFKITHDGLRSISDVRVEL